MSESKVATTYSASLSPSKNVASNPQTLTLYLINGYIKKTHKFAIQGEFYIKKSLEENKEGFLVEKVILNGTDLTNLPSKLLSKHFEMIKKNIERSTYFWEVLSSDTVKIETDIDVGDPSYPNA